MIRAKECASSEECSLEDAQSYLSEILRVEGGCVAGTLVSDELCDIDFATDVVVDLRSKIEKGLSTKTTDMVIQASAQILFIAAIGVILALSLSTVLNYGNAVPFTLQEWYWAAKDGYLSRMILESWKYGGLENSDGTGIGMTTAPFTLQEWWWSVRDGYLPKMVSSFVRDG